MATINLSKLEKELSKGSTEEQITAFHWVKSFVTLKVLEQQKLLEEKANELQQTLENIKGQANANI
jgi:hypothetical protein